MNHCRNGSSRSRTEALGEILGVPTRGYDELSAPVPHEVLLHQEEKIQIKNIYQN